MHGGLNYMHGGLNYMHGGVNYMHGGLNYMHGGLTYMHRGLPYPHGVLPFDGDRSLLWSQAPPQAEEERSPRSARRYAAPMLRQAFRSVASQLAAGVDRAVYSAALARSTGSRRRSRAEGMGHQARMDALAAVSAIYERPGHDEDPDAFFTPPDPAGLAGASLHRVRAFGDFSEVADLRWTSQYQPFSEAVRGAYLRRQENRAAVARLFLRKVDPRPAVILIHGYLGGTLAVEERLWPVRWLHERGFDVALAVLPFHGSRRDPDSRRPVFPSSDPRVTIEGFRQAIFDLRFLVGYLRSRGAPSVGVMGMSLGGYTSALLATVEPRLSFAVPMIPLASIADFARDGGRLVGSDEEQWQQHAALEAAHRVVSPLSRPPRLDPRRILVVAGESDQITPLAHAERLAAHLGARLETFAGGHLFQIGREDAFRLVGRMLDEVLEETAER